MNIAYQPKSGTANLLLTQVAHKIQLPPSLYSEATKRYETMSAWISRDASPLHGLVKRLYGQGSAAIGAVINSKFDKDEFDIDAVVELAIPANSPPDSVLKLLQQAISGEPGSRYHKKTLRRSRCITVEYDDMHIDFTPAVLVASTAPRTSIIFHACEEEPASKHYHKIANPWGFANWFEQQTPAVLAFADELRKAETEPLPDPEALTDKSLPLVALQLIKRWRNKVYDQREGRMPPSVMLAYYVGAAAKRRFATLLEELSYHVGNIQGTFAVATKAGNLVHVANPRCDQDVLTDRWPADLEEQKVFLADLTDFSSELSKLRAAPTIAECQRILGKLFGETATADVVKAFAERYSAGANNGQLHHQLKTGAIALGASGLSSRSFASSTPVVTPRHRNFGSAPQ